MDSLTAAEKIALVLGDLSTSFGNNLPGDMNSQSKVLPSLSCIRSTMLISSNLQGDMQSHLHQCGVSTATGSGHTALHNLRFIDVDDDCKHLVKTSAATWCRSTLSSSTPASLNVAITVARADAETFVKAARRATRSPWSTLARLGSPAICVALVNLESGCRTDGRVSE